MPMYMYLNSVYMQCMYIDMVTAALNVSAHVNSVVNVKLAVTATSCHCKSDCTCKCENKYGCMRIRIRNVYIHCVRIFASYMFMYT